MLNESFQAIMLFLCKQFVFVTKYSKISQNFFIFISESNINDHFGNKNSLKTY